MTQDVESQHYIANRKNFVDTWQPKVEQIQPEPPSKMPTEQIVANKAQFLGEFINNSDKKSI